MGITDPRLTASMTKTLIPAEKDWTKEYNLLNLQLEAEEIPASYNRLIQQIQTGLGQSEQDIQNNQQRAGTQWGWTQQDIGENKARTQTAYDWLLKQIGEQETEGKRVTDENANAAGLYNSGIRQSRQTKLAKEFADTRTENKRTYDYNMGDFGKELSRGETQYNWTMQDLSLALERAKKKAEEERAEAERQKAAQQGANERSKLLIY